MKIAKRITTIILAICIFIVSAELWKYILIDDSRSYTRIMMHQLHHPDENIDILFVGSSHVYRALIPEITDKEFEKYTFNGGSSSQYMDGSLAVIKEANKHNNLKQIFLEVYYAIAYNEPNDERTVMTPIYIISDYMYPSIDKVRYITNACDKEYWFNGFLVARRNWSGLFDLNYMKDVILSKGSDDYKNFIFPKKDTDTEYYIDRGFVANDTAVDPDTHFNIKAYDGLEINSYASKDSDWYNSLIEIVEYCKDNNIELTLFITPEPEWSLVGMGNYQDYHNRIADISQDLNLDFIDFNLCKNEFFDTNDHSMFKDEDHLNTKGAQQFSILFGKVCSGRIRREDALYSSFPEKISANNIVFYGIADRLIGREGYKDCRIITGANDYEFRIYETSNSKEKTLLKDYNKTLDFELPIEESGTLTILCKSTNTNIIKQYEIDF